MIYLQLFLSFLQIGMFSFGGGYITDNTGPHCSEFRHLRGTEDCRDSRSCGGNGRVYFAVLHYCDDPGKTIPEVS